MTDRRMFLQTAGAALALPLVGGELALAQAPKHDVVLAELLRQMKAALKRLTRPGAAPGGEPIRQLANALRTVAAHGATTRANEQLAKALRDRIATDGRPAVLAYRPDVGALAATLEADGIAIDVSRLTPLPHDPAARSTALDAVLAGGATHVFRTVARAFEDLADTFDRQRGGIQLASWYYIGDCTPYQWQLFMLEVTMITSCYWAVAVPELCAIAIAAYLAMRLLLMAGGC